MIPVLTASKLRGGHNSSVRESLKHHSMPPASFFRSELLLKYREKVSLLPFFASETLAECSSRVEGQGDKRHHTEHCNGRVAATKASNQTASEQAALSHHFH